MRGSAAGLGQIENKANMSVRKYCSVGFRGFINNRFGASMSSGRDNRVFGYDF